MQYAQQISKRLTTHLLRFMSRIVNNNKVIIKKFNNIITVNYTNSLQLLFFSIYNSLGWLFLAKLHQNLEGPQQISRTASTRLCLLWMPFSAESFTSFILFNLTIVVTVFQSLYFFGSGWLSAEKRPRWWLGSEFTLLHCGRILLHIFWSSLHGHNFTTKCSTSLKQLPSCQKFNYLRMVPSIRP